MNILVTGASRGIGKTIAKSLQSYGNVYVTARNEEKLKEFGNEMYFVCDLSKEEDLLKLGDFIQEKKIDILVNNAGEYTYCGIEDTEISKLNEMLSINLKAPIIINVDTMKGVQLIADNSDYQVRYPIYDILKKEGN